MKIIKQRNIFLSAVFLCAICLPLIFSDKMGGQISVNENRKLAEFPMLKINGEFNAFFTTQFEAWINDNLGFKRQLVAANRLLNYTVFKEYPGSKTVVGKDGWLFLAYEADWANVQHADIPTEEELLLAEQNLKTITSFLKERNCDSVFMIWPNKITAYREKFPNSIYTINEKSRIDVFNERLGTNPKFDFSIVSEPIKQVKKEHVLYSKAKDLTHWNQYGAFIGYRELMNRAQKHLPDLKVLNFDDFNISTTEIQVPLAWKTYTSETDYNFEYKYERKASEDSTFFTNINYLSNDNTRSYRHYVNADKNLPKAIVMGDSFIWMFMLPNLAESFSELTFIHYYDMDNFEMLVNYIQPDIVLGGALDPHFMELVNFIPTQNIPVDRREIESLPIRQPSPENGDAFWVDYINANWLEGYSYQLDSHKTILKLDGWAVDVLNRTTASEVIIEVGAQFYLANYGYKKEGVAQTFNNSDYLNSGLTISLKAEEVLAAGGFTMHIISCDGTYRYPPIQYTISK